MKKRKRIMGILIFQNMGDALKAMDKVEDAGYELNIRHDLVDAYSAAVFVVHDELEDLVDPFTGTADDVGVFAEGEPHDFYGTGDGTKPPAAGERR